MGRKGRKEGGAATALCPSIRYCIMYSTLLTFNSTDFVDFNSCSLFVRSFNPPLSGRIRYTTKTPRSNPYVHPPGNSDTIAYALPRTDRRLGGKPTSRDVWSNSRAFPFHPTRLPYSNLVPTSACQRPRRKTAKLGHGGWQANVGPGSN